MTDTEFNAVKAFLSAYRYTELDLRVRRAELTRLTARKEALILEGNTDLLFHLEHAICAAKDAIRVLCTRQAEIEAAIDTVESAALHLCARPQGDCRAHALLGPPHAAAAPKSD